MVEFSVLNQESNIHILIHLLSLLYNSMNNLYKPIELSMIANTQEDIKYLKFKQLYEKILN